MTTQSNFYPDDTYNQYTALNVIWGDDDALDPNEQHNTSTTRIKPPKQVWEPFYIRLEGLESIREIKEQHSDR